MKCASMGGLMTDKVLITNASTQREKYGARGYRRVQAAIRELVTADRRRGLQTIVVDISDAYQMRKYKALSVSDARSEVQNKNAVDCIYAAIKPHYLVLLDGPDVIPHLLLNNPIPGDKDRNVPSDLPYASDERFLSRDAAKYAAPTRVVGRIPGVTKANDPTFLISQIKTAAAFSSRRREDYLSHFAISAYLWRKSTERSVENVFRSAPIKISPPSNSPKIRRMLAPLCHFINCHGGENNPNFYGQRGSQIIVSMTSDDVAKAARRHTIVAAECCFGAQLFAPDAAHGKLPISNAYLNAGAIAFLGSTTTTYGSPDRNGSADLIAQYFLIEVLDNASSGRACLQARHKFVYSQKMHDPVNLKTLAQFILLGDPSLQPVRGEAETNAFSKHIDTREARRTRRIALAAAGQAAASCSSFPGKKIIDRDTPMHGLVREIARRRGLQVRPDAVDAYEVIGRENYGEEMKARDVKQRVFVATHHETASRKPVKGAPLTRILVAHAQNNHLTEIVEYVRR